MKIFKIAIRLVAVFLVVIFGWFLFVFVVAPYGYEVCSSSRKISESEMFLYVESDGKASILGLTDLGKQQEYLVIPEKINDNTVTSLGINSISGLTSVKAQYGEEHILFRDSALKKLYIPFNPTISEQFLFWGRYPPDFWGETKIEAFVVMRTNYTYGAKIWENNFVRMSNNCFGLKYKDGDEITIHNTTDDGRVKDLLPANVTYYLNPGQEPNAVYWVDDYDGEKIKYMPPDPAREGFEFAGWFKERECVNKWDFENDIVPKKIYEYDSDGTPLTYTYVETKLYAKWIPV